MIYYHDVMHVICTAISRVNAYEIIQDIYFNAL